MDRRAHSHICISPRRELRPLREAKARGVDITGETCPQYLFLSTDDYSRLGGIIRVNPPVREAENQAPLWAALADGTVDLHRDRPRAARAAGEDRATKSGPWTAAFPASRRRCR
jgi:hypothetical protein